MVNTRSQTKYQQMLDKWVSVNAASPVDWLVLLESLPSVYPAFIRNSAVRLDLWENVAQRSLYTQASAQGSIALGQWLRGVLPTGHCLDSSWWFTDGTLNELARWVTNLSSPGQTVALLGTPTLFHYLQEKCRDRNLFLVDRYACDKTSNSLNVIEADLLRSHVTLPGPAAVMVVDPPWYESELQAFLWNARLNSIRGTKIVLSAPALGTRPDIDREWNALAHWCEDVGFEILERRPLALRYLSPLFETNALRADGLPECSVDWRRGDLILLQCVADRVPSPLGPKSSAAPSWNDFCIGRVRVKVRSAPANDNGSSLLREIVGGDVLPSVSRRDCRLEKIALWTSGNRVFGSNNVPGLCSVVEAMATGKCDVGILCGGNGQDPGHVGTTEAARAINRLKKIIEIEETELEEWSRKQNANVVQLTS